MQALQQERCKRSKMGFSAAASIVLLTLGLLVYLCLNSSRSMLVSIRYSEQTVTVVGTDREAAGKQPVDLQAASKQAASEFTSCRGPEPGVVIPHLRSVQQWRSSRPRQKESVTLVTQLSIERLEMLENQCSVWPDPIAAAVYVETVQGLILSMLDASINGSSIDQAVSRLGSFHARMEAEGSCILDLELATEDFSEEGEAGLYPFNAARNRALMLAQTQAVMILDADFIPAPQIVEVWKTPQGYAQLMNDLNRKQAFVIPAFQTESGGIEGKQLAFTAAQGGKERAVQEYRAGNLSGAQLKRSASGHFATNYELWAAHDRPYEIKFQVGFEPYVLVSRRFLPWYDERFRGYGWDKKQHILYMAGLGVTFTGHPTAFAVHVPHVKAPTHKTTKTTGQWDKLFGLFKQVQRDVRKKRYVPVVSFSCPRLP